MAKAQPTKTAAESGVNPNWNSTAPLGEFRPYVPESANLPEFTFVMTQSRKDKDIVLGDLFGNVILNTPTLGLLAIISPFTISQRAAALASCAFLAALVVLFGIFMWTKKSLSRREGFLLLGFYAAYLLYYGRFLH